MAPLGAWPLTLIGLAGLAGLHLAGSPRMAAITAWAFATGYFTAALHWLVEPFMVDIARHGWMAPFALAFMAGGLALFWGGASWLAARFAPGRAGWVLALTTAELARAYAFGGFPWASPVQALIDTPAAQALAWVGPYGVTALLLSTAALIQGATAQRRLTALTAPAALMIAVSLPALMRPAPLPRDTAPLIRVVQPNAPQREKWIPERSRAFFRRALALSAGGQRPNLVIWPETSIPVWLSQAEPAFQAIAEQARVPVVAGINANEAGRAYNSLVVVAPDGTLAARYDKHHLVPFGEYLPAPWLLKALGFSAFTAQAGYGFSAGPGPEVLDLGTAGHALPLICYEAIFPQDTRAAARPGWLVQITNDAWFGNFSGPQQHLAQARMRAIEQGLPLVRAANTGISAVVDAYGQVAARLPLNTSGRLDVILPGALAPTPYARSGDFPFAVLLFVCLGLVTLRQRGKSV